MHYEDNCIKNRVHCDRLTENGEAFNIDTSRDALWLERVDWLTGATVERIPRLFGLNTWSKAYDNYVFFFKSQIMVLNAETLAVENVLNDKSYLGPLKGEIMGHHMNEQGVMCVVTWSKKEKVLRVYRLE